VRVRAIEHAAADAMLGVTALISAQRRNCRLRFASRRDRQSQSSGPARGVAHGCFVYAARGDRGWAERGRQSLRCVVARGVDGRIVMACHSRSRRWRATRGRSCSDSCCGLVTARLPGLPRLI
jgi:hypothetical protein